MNQTKNYLETKSVSLIVVDYFVVMIVLQVRVETTHYLVAAGVAVDCLLPSWKYSQWNCSELQPLLLATKHEQKIIVNTKFTRENFTHLSHT